MASAMSDKTDDNLDPYKQIIPKEIGSLDSSDGNEGDAFINNLEFRRWLILFVFVLIQYHLLFKSNSFMLQNHKWRSMGDLCRNYYSD